MTEPEPTCASAPSISLEARLWAGFRPRSGGDRPAYEDIRLTALKPKGRSQTVAGDDAQAISSFRAATVRNILDFPSLFSPPATVLTLARNYRSTQPILAAANAVIDLASERYAKQLWSARPSEQRPRLVSVRDEVDQAGYIADRVLEVSVRRQSIPSNEGLQEYPCWRV